MRADKPDADDDGDEGLGEVSKKGCVSISIQKGLTNSGAS